MADAVEFQRRNEVWQRIKESKNNQPIEEKDISITLPDGKEIKGIAGKTTPAEIAKQISNKLAQNAIAAKVNGEMYDLSRPFEKDSALEIHTFDSADGKKVFWHSSAHILGEALELKYKGNLCTGPPLKDGGFYYDIAMLNANECISTNDFAEIKTLVNKVIKEKQTFERLVLTKSEALELFSYNKYKVELIGKKVGDDETCTAYKCGNLIDLCKGPHIPHTGRVKAFDISKNSSAYWLGKAENDSLQRVYGIAFPDNKLLTEWKKFQEEAERRDHRKIGAKQELFFFDPLTPGCAFFLPHGTRVYNKLQSFVRCEYRKRGFEEVVSPNIFNVNLWKTSGHWQNYQENMFSFDVEGQQFALKPMNCPGHCVMFGHRVRSYRELPLRFADFGVLHRNELSGALTGLTRVRRFQQDDAHIFCRRDQVRDEIENAIKFMNYVYGVFGFTFALELSTRPEKFLGEVEVWNQAEKQLEEVLNESGHQWKLNPGDGAFYGPKIDIHITDALRRSHQCATIQLDFQLPIQFNLEYATEKGTERPVIIHRAIYGSLERFTAILIEHTGGEWPFWLSPRQLLVVPIGPTLNDFAVSVQKRFFDAGFYVDSELSDKTFNKKMMNARLEGFYNYILVVGEKEQENDSVNIRTRDNKVLGMFSINELISILRDSNENFKDPSFPVKEAPVQEKKDSQEKLVK